MKGPTQLNIHTPSTETSLYLYNVNTEEEINFKLIPDQLVESYSPNIISESPFGILHPINFYTGGSDKKLSFSFDIHEDMIIAMDIAKDLYSAMDKLKRMSEPYVISGVYREPLVYLQMGTQFAGKGHIVTSISYNKPFSNKAYKLASISVTFTFHELFATQNINRMFLEPTLTEDISFSLDLTGTEFADMGETSSEAITNFYQTNLDPSYIVNSILFSDKMLENFWSPLVEDDPTASVGYLKDFSIEEIKKLLISTTVDDDGNTFFGYNDILNNTFFQTTAQAWFRMLFTTYAKFIRILLTRKLYSYEDLISNLDSVLDALDAIEKDYMNSFYNIPGDPVLYLRDVIRIAYTKAEILEMLNTGATSDILSGWYRPGTSDDFYIQLSEEQENVLIDYGVNVLRSIVTSQISAYTLLRNKAGD
jgi:hypothetical protein